ncbi:hypothetical protein GWK91_01745 [Virgibacillus sp. MSP4-1]|uniref:hypothetical protein n=1 Tax=Virgibacillus sp. MSP4-1 TaxID=2700081 RepID=UPI00137BCABF|nr:hypothetical protein [Virgibacillus sp. MSP4-1]QHS21743.1 hypothetical protein GWK91_01745 [Virgibacillus sp. MSP4-1]
MLKDAIWLATNEYKQNITAVFITFFASSLLGFILGGTFTNPDPFIIKIRSTSVTPYLFDFMIIGTAPAFSSLFMSKPYLSYKSARKNPYLKQMAVLRTLPITLSALALSRILFMILTLLTMSLAFFGSIGILIAVFPDYVLTLFTISELILLMIVWFGFMLAVGGLSPFLEYGTSGKALHIIPFIYVAIITIAIIVFYQYFSSGIAENIIGLVKTVGWPVALFSMTIGIAGCLGWNRLLQQRMANKDFL